MLHIPADRGVANAPPTRSGDRDGSGTFTKTPEAFVRAIETSDFDRRLQGLENKLNAPTTAGNAATGSGWHYNRW